MEPLKKTLKDLQDRNVIKPVKEPTDWVNSLVATQKKNGTLRVCLDPCDLNQAVKRQHYSIPTHEDVRSKLAGKSIFTILDEKDGYWQIKLDEPSSKLCTFNTPWGRFRFLRLPFGIKSASEVFQQKNCETFGDIPGVFIIADDMIIAATSEREHDEILQKVMERAKTANVKFNKDKIQFKVDTVKYMGHIITAAGQKADDTKIKAIIDMPTPEDKQSLQRLLGMVKFLAQYIPNEASVTAPLRQLLKKDTVWQWQPHHTAALSTLKTALTQAPVLRFYYQTKSLTLQADSSKDGLGACLLQDGQPVCYASRALTDTEKRYAQIEKELLAIVFATKRFHQYVYGRPVTVQSDHKPLEAIMRKPLSKAPARLQGMLLQLQRYELTVTYTPGKHMFIADALSRATATSDNDATSENGCDERVVYALEATEALSEDTLNRLRTAVATDSELQGVCEKHIHGWPAKRKSLDRALYCYWPMRHNISIHKGIVMVGDKIVIPQNFRQTILEKLHMAHQGIQRTKAKARKVLYWPGMSSDIETMIQKCEQCQQMQPKNQAEPLVPHMIPELPWMKIGADIFELEGQPYLLLIDYLTKYPEVLNLPDKTAYSVIQKMKSVFARHRIPKEIVSDHVPFASYEMKSFADAWEIKLTHSSPGFPSSNGMAERAIKTVKHALKKAIQTGTDPHLVMLSLRNTPVTGLNLSPAQMLMGRVLRSTLPCSSNVLRQSTPQNIPEKLRDMQLKQKLHFDKRARPLPVLSPGDTVHMQIRRGWEPAVIVHQREEPRSYTVRTPSGNTLRRNRRHLRKTNSSLFKDTTLNLDSDGLFSQNPESVDPPACDSPQKSSSESMENTAPYFTRSGRAVIRPARYRD
uniref:Gypsy retrotransposon integrase-like protein 1 n=1 Tax=Oryzias sinensis TaxID=183150 RepID=A0A8C7ZN50_9TELE